MCQFHLNLLQILKDRIVWKNHVLSKAGESTSHPCKKGPKHAHIIYNYASDHWAVYEDAFLFLDDIGEKQFKNMTKHLKVNSTWKHG